MHATQTNLVTAQELIDGDDALHEFIDDMYWSGGYNSTRVEKYFEVVAAEKNVTVVDPDNIDEAAYNAYQCAEKGLS